MKQVLSHSDADEEWQASVDFYGAINPKVAFDFNERIRHAFKEIARNPERYSFVREMPPVRHYRLKRFPFSIIYLERRDYIWVLAVAHSSRRPGYWKNRLR